MAKTYGGECCNDFWRHGVISVLGFRPRLFFLYCHFQNNGKVSFANAVFKIKQPMDQSLEYSTSPDQEDKCKKNRNNGVEKECKKIFGDNYYQNIKLNSNLETLRQFQEALLSIQAIQEVKGAGAGARAVAVYSDQTAGPKLVRAKNFQHPQAADGDLKFDPISEFEEIKSVKELDNWDVATTFNLLHFFRNFTSHRTLIECGTKPGHLNRHTMEFGPGEDGQESRDGIFIGYGNWIMVPELSHLRDRERKDPITFYSHPLLIVCNRMFSFVKVQKHNLLRIVDGKKGAADDLGDMIKGVKGKMKIDGREVEWYEARSTVLFNTKVFHFNKAHQSVKYTIFTLAVVVVVIGFILKRLFVP